MATHLSTFKRYRFDVKSPPTIHPNRQSRLFLVESVSNLKRKMDGCKRSFATARKLGRSTNMKTWGLASHGDVLASIISLHPSEMVEYITLAQERSTIVFSSAALENGSPEALPPKDRESNSTLDAEENGPRADTSRRRKSAKDISFPWERERTIVPRNEAQRAFLRKLTFQTLESAEPACSISAITTFHLACARFLYENDASQFLALIEPILTHPDYAEIVAKLKQYESNEETNGPTVEAMDIVNSIISTSERHPQRQIPIEQCMPECGKRVEWRTLSTAKCSVGHQWSKFFAHSIRVLAAGLSNVFTYAGLQPTRRSELAACLPMFSIKYFFI